MAFDLNLIEYVVVVMMENRSFDHILGYLGLPQYGQKADGISYDQAWITRTTNKFNGVDYAPFHFPRIAQPGGLLGGDPPHERGEIRVQIAATYPWPPGGAPMNGFVKSYTSILKLDPGEYWRSGRSA